MLGPIKRPFRPDLLCIVLGLLLCLGSTRVVRGADWSGSPRTLEDPAGRLGPLQVLARSQDWVAHPADWVPHFGFSRSVFWIDRSWSTVPGDTNSRVLLVRSSVIDTLDMYVLVDGRLDGPYRFGDRLPYITRALPCRQFALAVHPGRDGRLRILLRTATHDGLHESVPFEIVETRAFWREFALDGFHYGVYFGSIVFLVVFSLLLSLAMRDPAQLAFAGYSFFFGVWNMTFLGFADEILWPTHPRSNLWIMLSLLAFGAFLVLFTSRFLDMRREMPRHRRFLQGVLLTGSVPAIPFALFDLYRDFFLVTLPMDLLLLALLLSAGGRSAWRGHAPGRIYLLSWTPVVGGAILLIGKVLGVLPAWKFIENAYQYGTIFHALVLSVGAAIQIMLLQKKANIDLESQVVARTHDLEEANHRLEELSSTDFLTGVPNRRSFLERHLAACRERPAEPSPVTILLLDVDHFKAYNDHLGHLAGDACLQAIARCLMASLRRGSDFCARYGGEEFVLCLVGTPVDEGLSVAERIRERLESQAIPHPASPTAPVVTISLGLAVGTTSTPLEELLRRADTSLYEAKRTGRNRVGPPR